MTRKKAAIVQGGLARDRQRSVGDLSMSLGPRPEGYVEWFADVKARVHAAQQRAALAVNKELLQLYWQLGHDLSDRRQEWGSGVIDQVSSDMRAALDVSGDEVES